MPSYKTAKGTYDLLPTTFQEFKYVKELFEDHTRLYGYECMETPIFEQVGVFKRDNDTSDMVNKEMYVFNDGEFALRPEGTAGIIRSFVEHKLYANEMPIKLSYHGKMFRKERPQKGRQREFTQLGVECLGDKNPMIDAEVIAMGYNFLTKLGLKQIKVLVNTLGDSESRLNYAKALKQHFQKGIGELCHDCQMRYHKNPLRILDCKVDHEHALITNAPKLSDYLSSDSKEYFKQVLTYLDALKIPYEVSEKLVRGLDYYTDTVFEVISTNEESGAQNTLFGGGRYDDLVSYFDGPQMSGIGFAMGLERILILANASGLSFPVKSAIDLYVIDLTKGNPEVLRIANLIREAGYDVEVNYYDRKLKAQFKSVDRKAASLTLIIGEDELANKCYNLKSNLLKSQQQVSESELLVTIEKLLSEVSC